MGQIYESFDTYASTLILSMDCVTRVPLGRFRVSWKAFRLKFICQTVTFVFRNACSRKLARGEFRAEALKIEGHSDACRKRCEYRCVIEHWRKFARHSGPGRARKGFERSTGARVDSKQRQTERCTRWNATEARIEVESVRRDICAAVSPSENANFYSLDRAGKSCCAFQVGFVRTRAPPMVKRMQERVVVNFRNNRSFSLFDE